MAVQGSEWTAGAIVPHLAVSDLDEAVEFTSARWARRSYTGRRERANTANTPA
jgi:hypothetical protein